MENKIVPIEKMSYKDGEIAIGDVSITYVQQSDCTEEDGTQVITISTRNNGIARFINIKTPETEGWSVDGIEDLQFLINDFKKRADLCQIKSSS